MPQTRRQAHSAEHTDEAHSRTDALSLSLPEDVDLEALSELLPDTNITSPTSDTVINVYRLLLAQALEGRSIALELDETRAEIDKKEVELDQALQDKETASRDLEEALEAVQIELKEVRQEREQLGSIVCLFKFFVAH